MANKIPWDDPLKVLEILVGNEQLLLDLQQLKGKFFAKETAERKKIKKGGYLIEGERKDALLQEISDIDPELLPKVQQSTTEKDFVKAIDSRIKEVGQQVDDIQGRLQKILLRQRKSVDKGGGMVEEILEDLLELKKLFSREAEYFDENTRVKGQIEQAMEQGTITLQNIGQFITLAKKLEKNSAEEEKLLPKIREIVAKLKKLKELAEPIVAELEQEAEEAEKERAKVAKR